jgi:hypothetical protein
MLKQPIMHVACFHGPQSLFATTTLTLRCSLLLLLRRVLFVLQALSKNGEYLGDRYVRLLHVPKQEMEEQVRLVTLDSS